MDVKWVSLFSNFMLIFFKVDIFSSLNNLIYLDTYQNIYLYKLKNYLKIP